jgi:hypothetical protein
MSDSRITDLRNAGAAALDEKEAEIDASGMDKGMATMMKFQAEQEMDSILLSAETNYVKATGDTTEAIVNNVKA